MEFHSAASTVRHFARCVTFSHWTLRPMSRPVTPLCLLRDSSGRTAHQLRCLHSTSLNHRPRLSTQGCRTGVFIGPWTNTSLCEARSIRSCVGSVRGMAGHSKWANIRHIKAAKDNEKAKVINEYARKIRALIRETGQTDPKTSSQLARLIAEAKFKNVPNANIDRVLTQMVNLKNSAPVMFSAKGPAGSVMLIEALTTKMTQTKSELQSIVKKCGFSMFDSGSLAKIAFEEKGVVQVNCPGEASLDLEAYVDIAIEAGAEDVTLEDDEEGKKVLQFVCEPGEVYVVKKELEARQLAVSSAEVVHNSTSLVALDASILELISKALDRLEEHPDVLRVYTNVEEAA